LRWKVLAVGLPNDRIKRLYCVGRPSSNAKCVLKIRGFETEQLLLAILLTS
jgi:hypothetical protein